MSTHRRAVHFGTDLPTDQRQAFGCIVPWNVTSWVTDDEGATWYPEFHARGSIAITPGTTIPVYDGPPPDGAVLEGPVTAAPPKGDLVDQLLDGVLGGNN